MKTVSVKQLQSDLSRYLDEVRAGEELLIKYRNQPVAKLVPFNANGAPAARASKPVQKEQEQGNAQAISAEKGAGLFDGEGA